jgi:hypothetical protein
MGELRWKLIETYERPKYAGHTDLVLLGWDSGHPDGVVMFFGVGWLDDLSQKGKWVDCSDRKAWPEQPTHWLVSLRGAFEQDFRQIYKDQLEDLQREILQMPPRPDLLPQAEAKP